MEQWLFLSFFTQSEKSTMRKINEYLHISSSRLCGYISSFIGKVHLIALRWAEFQRKLFSFVCAFSRYFLVPSTFLHTVVVCHSEIKISWSVQRNYIYFTGFNISLQVQREFRKEFRLFNFTTNERYRFWVCTTDIECNIIPSEHDNNHHCRGRKSERNLCERQARAIEISCTTSCLKYISIQNSFLKP